MTNKPACTCVINVINCNILWPFWRCPMIRWNYNVMEIICTDIVFPRNCYCILTDHDVRHANLRPPAGLASRVPTQIMINLYIFWQNWLAHRSQRVWFALDTNIQVWGANDCRTMTTFSHASFPRLDRVSTADAMWHLQRWRNASAPDSRSGGPGIDPRRCQVIYVRFSCTITHDIMSSFLYWVLFQYSNKGT